MNFLRIYLKSFVVYGVVVSGLAALAEWSSFACFIYGKQMHYLFASVLAFLVGTSVNAGLSCAIGFKSKGRSGLQEAVLIYVASALAFLINIVTLFFLVQLFNLHVMLAKISGTFAAFFANYLLRQFFIFSSEPRWK